MSSPNGKVIKIGEGGDKSQAIKENRTPMAIKLERGRKALMAWPLVEELFLWLP